MKTILKKSVLTIYLIIGISSIVKAQTANLYYQIKGNDFNIENTRKALSNLRSAVAFNKNSSKRKKARILQHNAQLIANNSYAAYLKAKQIIKKLEAARNYDLAEKVGKLRSDLYNMYYAADALANTYCRWMINKPRVHKSKSFNSMTSAFNTIIKNFNKAQKDKKVLLDVANWEILQEYKKNNN